MPDLIQITYASRSTFTAAAGHRNIESNVARILAKARANNRRDGLAGVLYFGNGYFFQCLEGEVGAVESLFARLLADPRHTGLQVLTRKRITERTFEDWSMKYVPVEQPLVDLLREHNGSPAFEPYGFGPNLIDKILELFHAAQDLPDAALAQAQQQTVAQGAAVREPAVRAKGAQDAQARAAADGRASPAAAVAGGARIEQWAVGLGLSATAVAMAVMLGAFGPL